jgi:hypothetical protein
MAVPQASDVTKLVFDAYDSDGIYLVAIGDAFIARPVGTNGATLDYVHKGMKSVADYVDDASAGCVNGQNTFRHRVRLRRGGQVAVPLP